MPSEKKASEGIALLSMYGDEDDEMEDLDEGEEHLREEIAPPSSDTGNANDSDVVSDNVKEITPRQQEERVTFSSNGTPQQFLFSSPQQQQQAVRLDLNYAHSRKTRLTIVDYAHEEGALSPEAAEGEVMDTGRVTCGELLQTVEGEFGETKSPGITRLPTPSSHATPQTLELIDQPEPNEYVGDELESAKTEDAVMVSVEEQNDIDRLDKFLPPLPKAKCSEELQEKIKKFLALKRDRGKSFNAEVRNRKEYRNPDFLLHAVTYQNIDQIGSCFSKDVFDPHGYDKSDFYDEIEADMRRESERKTQESKRSHKIDFSSGGSQLANVISTGKPSIPNPGSTGIAAGISNITASTIDATGRDGRQNKKSKWDKVDVDQRNSVVAGGQENLSVGAQAALLSAAKAGGGYLAFANQRRKEAEEKRYSDKKLERRS